MISDDHCIPQHRDVVDGIQRAEWARCDRAAGGSILRKTVFPFDASQSGVRDAEALNGKLRDKPRTALQWFQLLWTTAFEQRVLNHTVSHHARYGGPNRVRGDPRAPPTLDHLRLFIAQTIFMGVVRFPNAKRYWRKKSIVNARDIFGLMSIGRYRSMKRHLAFADKWKQPADGDPAYDKAYLVRPLITHANSVFKRYFYPGRDMAFDEGAFRCDAGCPRGLRLDLKHKPCGGRGMQFEMLCDHATGIPWHMELYDKQRPGGIPKMVVEAVVTLEQRFHCIYADKMFTSPRMAVDLLRAGHYMCGTQNMQRVGTPPREMLVSGNAERGVEHSMQCGQLMLASIKDTGVVNILSTFHQPDERGHVRRWIGPHRRRLVCCKSLQDFNIFMTAVDKLRAMMASYAFARPSKRWPMHVFYDVLNTMVTVAFKLQEMSGGTVVCKDGIATEPKVSNHLDFRLALVRGLCASASRGASRTPATKRLEGNMGHWPQSDVAENGHARQYACVWCCHSQAHLKGRSKPKRVKCTTRCKACGVGLHAFPCFEAYHTFRSPYEAEAVSHWGMRTPGYHDTDEYRRHVQALRGDIIAEEARLAAAIAEDNGHAASEGDDQVSCDEANEADEADMEALM